MTYFIIFFLLILLSGCAVPIKKPDVVGSSVNQGEMTEARINAKSASDKADAESKAHLDLDTASQSQMKTSIRVIKEENDKTANTVQKKVIAGEVRVLESSTSKVAEDPIRMERANARRDLIYQGRDKEADDAYQSAVKEVSDLQEQITIVLDRWGKAIRERDEARLKELEAIQNYQKQIEQTKRETEVYIKQIEEKYKSDLANERNAINKTISRVLIGLGALFVILAGLSLWSGLQSGDILKTLSRAGSFFVCSAFCFALAWGINHPWFKYLLLASICVILFALGLYIFSEVREMKTVKSLRTDGEEKGSALNQVTKALDSLPKDSQIFENLSKKMDDIQKAVILETRAREKRNS